MVQLCLQSEWDKAERLALRYAALLKAVFTEVNPQGIKFAVSWLRKCQPFLRLPMMLPVEANQLAIKREILRLALPQFTKQTMGQKIRAS